MFFVLFMVVSWWYAFFLQVLYWFLLCVLPVSWDFSCRHQLWFSKTHKKMNHLWPSQMYNSLCGLFGNCSFTSQKPIYWERLLPSVFQLSFFFLLAHWKICLPLILSTSPICGMSSFIPYLSLRWQFMVCWQFSGFWPITAGIWIHQSPGARSFSQFPGASE